MVLSSCTNQSKAEVEALHRNHRVFIRFSVLFLLFASLLPAVTSNKRKKAPAKRAAHLALAVATAPAKAVRVAAVKTVSRSPWRVPNYADSTLGDQIEGEDAAARRAAVDALGKLNGAVVVANPNTGRVLSI